MFHFRIGPRHRSMLAALLCSGTLTVVSIGAASGPAAAAVTAVKGEACAYSVNVGLFGGPQDLLGCGEARRLPAPNAVGGPTAPGSTDLSYSPHVAVSGSGGSMTASDPDGAKAVYGPAVIHGGRWPCAETGDRNCPQTAPSSGPQVASTSGSVASGTVTASADISLRSSPLTVPCFTGYGPSCYSNGGFGPFPAEGDALHVECSASETTLTGSTTFTNANLATSTDSAGEPVDLEPVPVNPPVNYTRHGVITNVGDVFTVVYNQQIVNPDGSLTVNALHMYLFGPTAVGEVIRGQVTCGTTPSPLTPSDNLAPTCGKPVVKPIGPDNPTPQVPRQELIGTFDTGGIQSVTNIQVTNGTVQVGDAGGLPYLRFTPGMKGPLPVTATRTAAAETANLPMYWSFDVTDVAGNTRRCRGVLSPPVAVDDTYATVRNTPLTVPAPGVLANDTDADGGTLTAGSASAPANGAVTLNANGSFTYTPTAGFTGSDTFTYTVSDGQGGIDQGTVTITVTVPTANKPPVAVDDAFTTSRNAPLTLPAPGVLANDSDADGNTLTAGSATTPANGTVTLHANGSFTYTPATGFTGTNTFNYTVSDGNGGTDTGTVTITVTAAPTPPVAVDDAYATGEDRVLTVAAPGVLGNDTDANANTLTASGATTPANGTVTLAANGGFVYTPNPNFSGTDTFSYTVSDGALTDTGLVTITVTATNGSAFHPLTPFRIIDSRPAPNTVGPFNTPWAAGTTRDVTVTGANVPAGADAVTLNVTVTDTTGAGFLTIWPKGQTQPVASNLNWAPGQTIPNAVTVKIGATGQISITNPVGSTQVIIDLVGYYDGQPGDGYNPVDPARILDSRPAPSTVGPHSTPWGPNTTRPVTVTGAAGVPANADAVVLNATVTGTTANGFLTIWPAGQAQPNASSLNWAPGQTIPNAVTVKVGTAGQVSVFNAVGDTNVIFDVVGYFTAGTGHLFHPVNPARVVDTRPAPNQVGAHTTPWPAATNRDVQISGNGGIPAGAAAALLNVTVTGGTDTSFLSIWPAGQTPPLVSSLNWTPGVTIPNSVTTKLNATGTITIRNFAGTVHVIADTNGWYG